VHYHSYMQQKLLKDQRGVTFILELILVVFVLFVVGFVGYKAYQAQNGSEKNKLILPTQNPKDLPQSHNAFGFNLVKSLNAENKDENIFISPSSVSLALSMVYNGAGGETKNAMSKTLQFQNLDITKINQESLGLINGLKNPDEKVELSIANSVWTRKGYDIKSSFLEVVRNNYNAEASSLNFDSPDAAKTINDWVSKNTKGKIPTIVDNTSDKIMFLINATYFKGTWTTEFDKSLTEDRDFTSAKGDKYKHPFMKQKEDTLYLKNDDFQSVSLPYGENKRLSMYVFLPKNIDNFVNKLDIVTWNKFMEQYQETEGTVLLPRFKLEYEADLIPSLTQLGMGIVFQDGADFSGIAQNAFINEVKHKTYLDVNEEGTEAAAVTSVGAGITSVQPEKKEFYMEVNRPFFIAILDNQTQEVLFTGIIRQP
jgi:serine protease inhibitor